jgi:FtsP/CotA-like multicopper oxidase with cupredoxin domain
MRSPQYRLVRGTTYALLPALAVLALAGCGSDDSGDPGGTPSSSTVSQTPSTAPSTTPTAPSTSPKVSTPSNTTDPSRDDADVMIEATIAGGKITPNSQTVKANQGQTVKITVTSDEADELHVHGYDKEVELAAGKPGSVTFKADTKGTFEIETHESGKLVAKLIVS